MDSRSDLPPALRAPAHGDHVLVRWRADLGARRSLGDLSNHLLDLDVVVNLGERWGTEFAREAAYRQLLSDLRRRGPGMIEDQLVEFGYERRALVALADWLHTGSWHDAPLSRPWPARHPEPSRLLQAVADMRLPDLLGRSPEVTEVRYRNPVEVVLMSSGLVLTGVMAALRLVRDWSNVRSRGRAEAEIAAAEARITQADADVGESRAELARWLVDEAKAGRIPLPPSDMLSVVMSSDASALRRLAASAVEIEGPTPD